MANIKYVLSKREKPPHEWNDGKKDYIYCLRWANLTKGDLPPECLVCPDFVNNAQDGSETFYGRVENGCIR